MMLFVAMQAPEDELFYKSMEHEDWTFLQNYISLVEFPDDDKVIGSYKNFY
jgi:hypothetical protein